MKFTFRGFALAMAAVLVTTLPMTALAQKDDKKRSKQEKEEIETVVKMVDAAMAGQPAPSDVQMKIAPVFLKSQEARNFVPFTIEMTGIPQKDAVLYIRVVDPTAKPDSVAQFRQLPADSSGVLKLTVAPDTDGTWVHQLRRDGIVVWQGSGTNSWTLEGLKPGTYQLQSFADLNENGKLDAPDWWTRTEAETPIPDPEAIEVTVGWTVERQWLPGASPAPQTGPDQPEKGSASGLLRGGLGPIQK